MDDVDPPAALQLAPTEEQGWALGASQPLTQGISLPPWLRVPPPKKRPFNWPSGGKSPSWFKKLATCQLQHAERYRRQKPDPTSLDGAIGHVIHGALEDAANIRAFPGARGAVPGTVRTDELLYLLERQASAIRQDLEVIEGDAALGIVTAEVLARARQVVVGMGDFDLSNIWVDRVGSNQRAGAEYVWSFPVDQSLLVAGVADLIQAQPDPRDPHGPPLSVIVTDYKTGEGQLPSREELEVDFQAGFELCWARWKFPRTPRIAFRLMNLALKKSVTVEWTPGIDQLMRSFARAAWNLWLQKSEVPTVGSHCQYCPYRSGCNAYTQHLREETLRRSEESLENKSMPELLKIYRNAKVLEDMAGQRRLDAQRLILSSMGDKQNEYKAGSLVARKKRKEVYSLNDTGALLLKLAEATGQDLATIAAHASTVSINRLSSWTKTLTIEQQLKVKKLIDAHRNTFYTRPWIEVSSKEAAI